MTEFERTILTRLERLETKIERRSAGGFSAEQSNEFEKLPKNATVGADYVAYRFGCSLRAVTRNESGTHLCRRAATHPLRYVKREVDAAWRKYAEPPKEKVAKLLAAKKPRKRSILRNNK